MRYGILALLTLVFLLAGCTGTGANQKKVSVMMPPTLVNQKAPDFTATAVMPDNSFQDLTLSSYRGKYVVLFFFPMAFSIVCPTEVFAFNQKLAEFKKLDCEVIGVSVDSKFAHRAWRNTAFEQGGIGNIGYPLVADIDKDVSRAYGVLYNETVALRGLFLIDPEGKIRHAMVNDFAVGRNVDEAYRILMAVRVWDKEGLFCPANWREGERLLKDVKDS